MCLNIVDNVSTCRIIYFRYVDTEKRIDNSHIDHFETEHKHANFVLGLPFPLQLYSN